MLTPLQLPNRYDDLILQGVHGYRKVLVRCSAFVDPDTLQKIDPLDDSDWTVLGATSTGPFSPSDQVGSVLGGNVINVSKSTIIGAADDALVGQRLPVFCRYRIRRSPASSRWSSAIGPSTAPKR